MESKEAEEERRQLVKRKDAMDAEAQQEEGSAKRSRTIQIFVKVDGTNTVPMKVSPKDRVHDVVKKILKTASGSDHDVYVTCEGRTLRKDDELKSGGVRVGSTVQIVRRTRGGGKHKVKKKQVASTKGLEQKYAEEPKSDKGPAIRECDKDAAIRVMEENEEYRKLVEDISEVSDNEMEQRMQCFLAVLSGLDKGQREAMECGLRWAVEARRQRRETERKQTAGTEGLVRGISRKMITDLTWCRFNLFELI